MSDRVQKPKRQRGAEDKAPTNSNFALSSSLATTAASAARSTDTGTLGSETAAVEASPKQNDAAAGVFAGGHSLSRFSILPGGPVPSAVSPLRPQAKMSVSQPGEPAEVEAESTAEQVMRMPAPASVPIAARVPLFSPSAASSVSRAAATPAVSRAAATPAEQMGVEGDVDRDGADAAPAVNNALSGSGGQALDGGAQQFLGERMGQNFSQVRIHADESAARSADAVNAQAYTVGNNVVFGRGQYQPGTSAGKKLLAHELTHVVQQTGGAPQQAQAKLNPATKVSRFRQSDTSERPPAEEGSPAPEADISVEETRRGRRRNRASTRDTDNTHETTAPVTSAATDSQTVESADTSRAATPDSRANAALSQTDTRTAAPDARPNPTGDSAGATAETNPAVKNAEQAADKADGKTADKNPDTSGKSDSDGGKADKTTTNNDGAKDSNPGVLGAVGGATGAGVGPMSAAGREDGASALAGTEGASNVAGAGTETAIGGTQADPQVAASAASTEDVPERQPGTVYAADDDAAAAFPEETRMGRTANGFNLFETDAAPESSDTQSGATPPGSQGATGSVSAPGAPSPTTLSGSIGSASDGLTAAAGIAGSSLTIARKPNPPGTADGTGPQTSENGIGRPKGTVFPVPSSTAGQMAGHQRERIQQALSEFLAFGQERIASVNALSSGIAPQIQASTQRAHASIDGALQRSQGAVTNAVAGARQTAVSRADTSRQAVRNQHAQLLSDMATATAAAKQAADQEYTTGVATLDPLLQQNVSALGPLYEQSAQTIQEKANQTAAKAPPLANQKAAEFSAQTPEHSKAMFGLGAVLDNLDWDNYVSNWRKAKVTAAQDKGTEFGQKLHQDATQVISGQSGARTQIAAGFTEQTNKARTDMGAIRAASGGAFDTLQQEKLQSAQVTLDTQLASIDTQLQSTLSELGAMETAKQNLLQSQAAQQKTAVTQAGAAATTALQGQVTQAAASLGEQMNQVASLVRQTRQPASARSLIAEAKQSFDDSATQAQTGIAQGIEGVGGKITAQGESSAQQIDQSGQSAQSEADQKAQAFSSQMDQAASAAGQEFNGLRQQHQQAVQAATTRLKDTYKARADQLKQGFTTAIERQQQEFTKTETEFGNRAEQSFTTLPQTMVAAAQEAADKVQPSWKFYAKILVTIVVAIVCAVVVAALVASGVGIILAGVLVGAAAGIASQALSDIIDGKLSSFTDYLVSGVSGAIGGLIGGGAGVLGKMVTAEGAALMSAVSRPALQAATRFGATLGMDAAGGVAGGFVDFGLKSASAMWQGKAGPDFNLQEIVGMGLFGAALGKGIGSGMESSGLSSRITTRFGRPGSTGASGGTSAGETNTPAQDGADALPSLPAPEVAPANQQAPGTAGGETAPSTPSTAPSLPDAALTTVGADTVLPTSGTRTVPPANPGEVVPSSSTRGRTVSETTTPQSEVTPVTDTAPPTTETAPLGTDAPTAIPEAVPQDARQRYQAERHATRQADYEQFRQNKIAELRGDPRTASLGDAEIETAVRTARRQGQLSPADQYRMRYHLDAPTGRAAEIDARTGANYQRMIEARIASQDSQYRYTTDRATGYYESDGRISRPTYMTDERVTSNAESMSRAQVAKEWGVHTTGVEVPRGAITDVRVPRPFGDSPHVKRGWEPFTNSYPEYGRGGALQYKATTNAYDPSWAHPLENNYGQPATSGGTAKPTGGVTTEPVVAQSGPQNAPPTLETALVATDGNAPTTAPRPAETENGMVAETAPPPTTEPLTATEPTGAGPSDNNTGQRGSQPNAPLTEGNAVSNGRTGGQQAPPTTETKQASVKNSWGVDPATRAADIEAGVIQDGKYIRNPSSQRLDSAAVAPSGKVQFNGKLANGDYMYVVDMDGNIVMGTRAGQRMPHPTLVGGENPQVQAAGIVSIRGGRIVRVDNGSGHFKPGAESLSAANEAFRKLNPKSFGRSYQGATPYDQE